MYFNLDVAHLEQRQHSQHMFPVGNACLLLVESQSQSSSCMCPKGDLNF